MMLLFNAHRAAWLASIGGDNNDELLSMPRTIVPTRGETNAIASSGAAIETSNKPRNFAFIVGGSHECA